MFIDTTSHTRLLSLQDPYFMKNHLGTFECKLCLTLHANEVRSIKNYQ